MKTDFRLLAAGWNFSNVTLIYTTINIYSHVITELIKKVSSSIHNLNYILYTTKTMKTFLFVTLDLHGNRDILHTLATYVYNQALRELCICETARQPIQRRLILHP